MSGKSKMKHKISKANNDVFFVCLFVFST